MGVSVWGPLVSSTIANSIINVQDAVWGAVGNGVVNDANAILRAFQAGKNIYFPPGSYFLGDWSTSSRIFDLSALGDNFNIWCGPGVEFVVNTVAVANPTVFYLRDNSNFFMGPARFRDTGYNRTTDRGAIAYTIQAIANDWRTINLPAVLCQNMYCGIVVGNQSTNRVRGINVGHLKTVDCNRGANFQNQGDDVNIAVLEAVRNERAYFAYGVSGHKIKIYTEENYGTTGTVNISRAVGGYNTRDIDIQYTSRDNNVDLYHVLINHIDLLGGEISNIRVNVDIEGSTAYDAVRIVNYSGSGGPESAAASSNITEDIHISGSCDANARAITTVASFAAKRILNLKEGNNLVASQSLRDAFYLNPAARSLVPAWSASVAPAIGNGTLSLSYDVVNGVCTSSIQLVAGSTTTFGTGEWSFTLPFTAKVSTVGSVYILDSGTGFFIGACRVLAGSDQLVMYVDGGVNSVRSNTPMTWATNDTFIATISYPIS